MSLIVKAVSLDEYFRKRRGSINLESLASLWLMFVLCTADRI